MKVAMSSNRPDLDDVWAEALFASGIQKSDSPTADDLMTAIKQALQRFGVRGCAGQMAQEFGDHPESAAERMRWIRQLVVECFPLPTRAWSYRPAGSWSYRPAGGWSYRPAGKLTA